MKGNRPPNWLKTNYISNLFPKCMSQVVDKETLSRDTEMTCSNQPLKKKVTQINPVGTALDSESFSKVKKKTK